MKRKRPEPAADPPPPAAVTLVYEHLPPESRKRLDDALRSWASWHAAKFLPGYVPPAALSGSLAYQPDRMALGQDGGGGDGAGGGAAPGFAFEDRPAAPTKSGAETLWFNVSYEKVGDVPRYDRATDDLLHHSARKPRAASDTLLAADDAAAAGAGKPVKRLRGNTRCFNCGSYGHSLRECWREHNAELVEESKREHAESKGPAYRSGPRRYYLQGAEEGGGRRAPLEQTPGEFEGLRAGQLSAELREALGIGPLAPPPWLHRMRELGPPPGYLQPVPAPPVEPAEGAAKRAASAGGGRGAAAEPAGAAPAGGVEAADADLGDFIALGGSEAGGSEDEEDAGPAVQLACSVQFPGVNAPVPEGADERAWAQRPLPLLPGHSGYATPPADRRQAQPGSAGQQGHGSSGGARPPRWQPLRGLHPPVSEGGASARQQREDSQPPPPPMHRGASAPAVYAPPPPPEQPPLLPPGFGASTQHPQPQQGYMQQQQQLGYVQQQQAVPPPPPPPPPEDVYSVSRSDPGHMLAFGPRAAGQYGAPQYQWDAPPPPPQYHPGHYYGEYCGGWHLPQPPQMGAQQQQQQAPAQAPPPPPPAPSAAALEAQQQYQQRLWQADGRF